MWIYRHIHTDMHAYSTHDRWRTDFLRLYRDFSAYLEVLAYVSLIRPVAALHFLVVKSQAWDFPGSPVVKTSPSNAGGAGSIPGQEAKIPHASWPKEKKKIRLVHVIHGNLLTLQARVCWRERCDLFPARLLCLYSQLHRPNCTVE